MENVVQLESLEKRLSHVERRATENSMSLQHGTNTMNRIETTVDKIQELVHKILFTALALAAGIVGTLITILVSWLR